MSEVKRQLAFFMPMEPPTTTYQQLKISTKNKRIYKSPESVDAYMKLRAYLSKHVPEEPLEGPLELTTVWYFPGKEIKFKTTRPDCDNINKMFQDAMADLGFFKNDAEISCLCVSKVEVGIGYGIFVLLRELDPSAVFELMMLQAYESEGK